MHASDTSRGSLPFYDDVAGDWAGRYRYQTIGGHVLRDRLERALDALGSGPGTLLDVGCGPAVLAADFCGRGFRVIGVDGSIPMISEGHRTLSPDLDAQLCVADAQKLPFAGAAFDVAVCLGVINSLPDPERAIDEMVRAVRPGGRFVVSFANGRSPYSVWRRRIFYPLVRLVQRVIAMVTRRPAKRWRASASWTPSASETSALLLERGVVVDDIAYFGFVVVPSPLDEWFPRVATAIARRASRLRGGPLRGLGVGYVVSAHRTDRTH